MSIIFGETPNQQARGSALIADAGTGGQLAATMPFSVSLWMYFDQPPGTNETHTIFWYGDSGVQDQRLVVEATKNGLGRGRSDLASVSRGRSNVMKRAGMMAVAAALTPTALIAPAAHAQPEILMLDTDGAASQGYWIGVTQVYGGQQVERVFFVPTFIDLLRSQQWDCVMIVYYYPVEPGDQGPLLEALRRHLDSGGTLAITYPHLDEWPELQELLGVASAEDPAEPEAVFPTAPLHPTWIEVPFLGVDPPTEWFDFGDLLTPAPGGRVIGEYELSGDPVMLETQGGAVLVNGLTWDDWGPDSRLGRDQTYYLTGCLPDFDDNGALDLFDFLAFQNVFAAGDLRGDIDKNGRLNLFDFLIFQNAFELGCRPQ